MTKLPRSATLSRGAAWLRAVAFFLLLCTASLLGQSPQASIRGAVRDSQGAVVPDAAIVATRLETGVAASTKTNGAGLYSLPALPIGEYSVSAELAGFRRSVRAGITLTTAQALELDMVLEVGAVTEVVNVSGSSTLLETRTSDSSQLIESRTIEDMPLGDRRALNVIEITGAAVFTGFDNSQKANFSLAGGKSLSQMFLLDGGSGQNMRLGTAQIDVDPPIGTLREVKVLANNFSAEYGGSAGGVVIATTRSGTNRFSGALSEYLRNQALDAPAFFAPVVDRRKSKPSLRYNVFSGTLGGPIRRDKTFFFVSYEGSRRRDGSIKTLTVPSALERLGDFSQSLDARGRMIAIYDPASVTGNRRAAFPGNRIPESRFDRVASNLIPLYPVANRAPDDLAGANNFRANDVTKLTRENIMGKLDHSLGSRDKLSARYIYSQDSQTNASVFPERAADNVIDQESQYHFWYAEWTRILTPASINEVRFTYGRRSFHGFSKGLGGNWPSKLGLRGISDEAFPSFAVTGYSTMGIANQNRMQFPIQQYHIVDNFSWNRGRHFLKVGAEVRPSMNLEENHSTVSGAFSFGRPLAGQLGDASTGNGFAGLLLGSPTGFSSQVTPVLDRHSWYLSGFLQDDWKIHPNLTLNLGVRWEMDTPLRDANNRMNGFDPTAINPVSGTPGVIRFAGRNGWPERPYDPDWNNFGPRAGFAWKPLGWKSTVLRGGYGIFFSSPFDGGAPTSATLGFAISSQIATADDGTPIPYRLSDELPLKRSVEAALDDRFGAVAPGRTATTAVTFFERKRPTGYSQQFNLRLQHELPGALLVEAGYLGNLSRKLPNLDMPINQIRPELLGPGAAQSSRPYPQFSGVSVIRPTVGASSYHAGTVKAEKRFSHGLNLLSTYTWSKFIDNVQHTGITLGDRGSPYSNLYNRHADFGPSDNDIRHRFTWSSVYELPLGKGRRFLAKHPARHVAGNWSVSAVATLQGGPALTVTTATNTTRAYSSGTQRADVVRNPNLPAGDRRLGGWFDTEAFRQPADYLFGNQGVNVIRADGMLRLNGSLIRTFALRERVRLQFRGEFFNAFNHPDFSLPAHVFGNAGFGIVNSARPGRQVQLGLRLTY